MNRGLLAAWALGLGVMTWREVSANRKPVPPGRYAAASGLYLALGLLAVSDKARPVAVLTAWGFDLALILQPGFLPAAVASPAARAGTTATTGAPATPGPTSPTGQLA